MCKGPPCTNPRCVGAYAGGHLCRANQGAGAGPRPLRRPGLRQMQTILHARRGREGNTLFTVGLAMLISTLTTDPHCFEIEKRT